MNVQLTGMACALLIVVSASGWRAESSGVPADPPYPGFSLTDVNQTSDQSLDMTWISVPGREYSLEYREGSEEGWSEVDRVVATGIRTTRRHDRPAANQHGQYRLRIVP